MHVNLSNVSPGNRTSTSDAAEKMPNEEFESKGFLETLAGVMTGESKPENAVNKAIDSETQESGNNLDALSDGAQSQETVTDAETEVLSAQDELLAHENHQVASSEQAKSSSEGDATSAMGEGQQLLGRIAQANQALKATSASVASGNALPQQVTDEALDGLPTTLEVGIPELESITVQRVSLDELESIDTKLAQGKPLTQQETEVLEGLSAGVMSATIQAQDLAQLVALPSDVKQALSEQQTSHSASRHMSSMTTTAQLPQTQAEPNADKAVIASPSDALAAAQLPSAQQGSKNSDIRHEALGAAFASGVLDHVADKHNKPELAHGLAGQLQAMTGPQGTMPPQQARIDAAQQAQLPLQLTKELANEQVAEKVQMMMSKNLKNLDIRLDPPELGRMQIRMTMNNDMANVHFTVNNSQARDMIEQTLPRLREMLAQQGMQLADSSVQQQSSGQQQSGHAAFAQRGQGGADSGLSGTVGEDAELDVKLEVNVASKRDGISFYA